jgi:hypothetical protein
VEVDADLVEEFIPPLEIATHLLATPETVQDQLEPPGGLLKLLTGSISLIHGFNLSLFVIDPRLLIASLRWQPSAS